MRNQGNCEANVTQVTQREQKGCLNECKHAREVQITAARTKQHKGEEDTGMRTAGEKRK